MDEGPAGSFDLKKLKKRIRETLFLKLEIIFILIEVENIVKRVGADAKNC